MNDFLPPYFHNSQVVPEECQNESAVRYTASDGTSLTFSVQFQGHVKLEQKVWGLSAYIMQKLDGCLLKGCVF